MIVFRDNRMIAAVVLGTVVLGGCGTQTNPGNMTVLTAPPGAVFTLPGPTTSVNLVNYKAAFNAWQRQGGHTRIRVSDQTVCDKCGTAVTIEAYPWASAYGPNHVPPAGRQVLVGYLVNEGPYATRMYSLKGNHDADYFLFATNVGGQIGWEMRELGAGTTGPMPIRSQGMYTSCGHGPPSRNEADFRRCKYESRRDSGILTLATSTSSWKDLVTSALRRLVPLDEDPAWISCTGGCCTLE